MESHLCRTGSFIDGDDVFLVKDPCLEHQTFPVCHTAQCGKMLIHTLEMQCDLQLPTEIQSEKLQ